jgi:hypothetical protein
MTVVVEIHVIANDLTGSGRNLAVILNQATIAVAIHPVTPKETRGGVVVVVRGHEKISEIDMMTARSEEAGVSPLRPVDVTAAALTKVDTIEMKTELSETNLVLRGVILHRPTVDLQTRIEPL